MGRAEFTRPGFILTFAGQGSHWQPVLREWLDHPDGETLRADIAAADGILGALDRQAGGAGVPHEVFNLGNHTPVELERFAPVPDEHEFIPLPA